MRLFKLPSLLSITGSIFYIGYLSSSTHSASLSGPSHFWDGVPCRNLLLPCPRHRRPRIAGRRSSSQTRKTTRSHQWRATGMSDLPSILSFALPTRDPRPAERHPNSARLRALASSTEADNLADPHRPHPETVHARHIDAEIIVADNGSTNDPLKLPCWAEPASFNWRQKATAQLSAEALPLPAADTSSWATPT